MSINYIQPPNVVHPISQSPKVFCVSDIHMGNTRPTNDLRNVGLAALLRFLSDVERELQAGNLHCFDLIFNGDTFDFWKAIPNPLPSEVSPGYPLHSETDYDQRFREIVQLYLPVWMALARILFQPSPHEMGAELYILNGNHDDPAIEETDARRYKSVLVDTIANAGLLQQLTPPQLLPVYRQAIDDRIHWGEPQIYYNQKLMLHIQHGHRWDQENILREENGQQLWSEGQIIVENFINGLHDLNLSTYEFSWKRIANDYPRVRKAMIFIDNFESELDGQAFIQAMAAGNPDVEPVLRRSFLATYWQADHRAMATIGDLPIPGLAGFLTGLYKFLFRKDKRDVFRQAAAGLLAQALNRIVLLGHIHVLDAIPDPAGAGVLVNSQYLNTGTAVDVLRHNQSLPTSPIRIDQFRPVKVEEIPGPPQRMARVWVWTQGVWAKWNDVRLP